MGETSRDSSPYLERLVRALRATARDVAPWFVEQMPESYFRDTDMDTVVAHMAAVVAARVSGASPRMLLRDEERETWTFIQEASYRGLLSDLLAQLPHGRPLASAKVHTAADEALILDIFRFGRAPRFDPTDPDNGSKLEETLAYARGLGDDEAPRDLPRYLERSSADFVRAASPLRLHETWRLVRAVEGTDAVIASVSLQREPKLTRISVAAGNADTRALFERIVQHLGRRGYDITRAFLDVFESGETSVSSLGFVVRDAEGQLLDASGPTWKQLDAELRRLPWLDDQVMGRLDRHPEETMAEAEALVALSRLVHARLAAASSPVYTRERLSEHLDRHPVLARSIARLFLDRFEPDRTGSTEDPLRALADRKVVLGTQVERVVETEPGRRFFRLLLEAVGRVVDTNAFFPGRGALALRIDAGLMDLDTLPFDVTFVHGRDFDGFYVRFAELSRGGLELVHPQSQEQHAAESERLYAEAHHRAFARHLEHRTTAEGGAQAVLLAAPSARPHSTHRAFLEALLDVFVAPPRTEKLPAPLLESPSRASPELHDWAARRAQARGHPLPESLLSPAPNVRVLPAATEAVMAVYLEATLRALAIDPEVDAFTFKLWVGPSDVRVAGILRSLQRRFGTRAVLVAIGDPSGLACDPSGLPTGDLLRLMEAGGTPAELDFDRLSKKGAVLATTTTEPYALRERLCFDLEADVFIPLAGEEHVHGGNWHRLFLEDRLTSRALIDASGAFVSEDAVLSLARAGMIVVPRRALDEGRILSESLTLAVDLLRPAPQAEGETVDPVLLAVVDKVEERTREAAKRLMIEHRRSQTTPWAVHHETIQQAVHRTAEALVRASDAVLEHEEAILQDSLPRSALPLSNGAFAHSLPHTLRLRLIASHLAARLIYRKGPSAVAHVRDHALARAALEYHRQEEEVARLSAQVRASGWPDAERIATLLEAGAAHATIDDLETWTGDHG